MTVEYLDAKRIQGSSTASSMFDGSDLKAYWQFNEASTTLQNNVASTITDNSTLGDNADLTLSGSPTTEVTGTPSGIGNAVTFDGSNDYAEAGTSVSQFNFTHNSTAKFSIGFWLKVNTFASNDVILDTGTHADALNTGCQLNLNGTDKMAFQITGSTATEVTYNVSSASYVPDTNWNHYVITWDYSLGSANCKFYLNGSLHDSGNIGSGTADNGDADQALNIGRNGGTNAQHLDGNLAEFFIIDRVITSTEIEGIYNSGNGNPLTTAGRVDDKATLVTTGFGSSANAQLVAGVTLDTSDKKLGTGSLDYDGASGTKIRVGEVQLLPSGTADYTYSFWVQFDSTSGDIQVFKAQDGVETYINSGDLKFKNSTGYTTLISSVSTGTWYHIIIENSGGTTYGYYNGGNVQSSTSATIGSSYLDEWYIGGKDSGSEALDGHIDDFAIWHRALTSDERTALYNSGTGALATSISHTDLKYYLNCDSADGANDLPVSNVVENTIFNETDTYLQWWLQDGKWKHNKYADTGNAITVSNSSSASNVTEVATDFVWSAGTNSNYGAAYAVGVGNKNNFIFCGGSGSTSSSQYLNGTTWTTVSMGSIERKDTGASAGTATQAIVAGGRDNSNNYETSNITWNGTSWTESSSSLYDHGEHPAGDGNYSDFLMAGGYNGSNLNTVDIWNGTAWASGTVINTACYAPNLAGLNASAMHLTGGFPSNANNEANFNGTSWIATGVAIPFAGRHYMAGGGKQDGHLAIGGYSNSGSTNTNQTDLWNGTAWETKDTLSSGRHGNAGDVSGGSI